MKDRREFYKFVTEAWLFVKKTPAPDQDDDEAWEKIIDEGSRLNREFTKKLADFMELLRDESMRGTI